jgi:cytohesin
LVKLKQNKMIYMEASTIFNTSPKDCFLFLKEKKFFSENYDLTEITEFLYKAKKWILKSELSQYLRKEENILYSFLRFYSFKNIPIDDGLRYLTFIMNITGESFEISNITRAFARRYYEDNLDNNLFESSDSAWIYSTAILMLNSDLHNPNNLVIFN